jgi:UDP-N-acetylmuramoyl-L-alanyl-D-glutamate--2,6-diaminopimelate ligase
MKLSSLLASLEAVQTTNLHDEEISGVASDSRQVRPGALFVAIPGEHVDGATYIGDALKRGASAIAGESERVLSGTHAGILLHDAHEGLACVASVFHGYPSHRMEIVGVTGTNGKTTIAFLVRDILRAAGRAPGMISTVEYEIGDRCIPAVRTTPGAVEIQSMLAQMLESGCRSAVMEVSSHALVQKRTHGVDFDVAVFTNLTRDHLDYHRTMDDYFAAKSLLFRQTGHDGKLACAVVNLDDPWGRTLAETLSDGSREIITYGVSEDAAVRAEDVVLQQTGSTCRVSTPWGAGELVLRLRGAFNISNALAAVSACGSLGVDLELMLRSVSESQRVPGRLEEVPAGHGLQVFVDYAHTDDALQNVLATLRPLTPGRLLLVFGCGGNRDPSKRPVMGSVANRLADHTILTSDNPRKEDPAEIIAQISRGFSSPGPYEVVNDRRAAIHAVVNMAEPGDVILIAGKGHETFQELAHRTVPFDDRQVVLEALEHRGLVSSDEGDAQA